MTLSIQNLLSEIDPNDTQFQFLDDCLISAARNKRGPTSFTFGSPVGWTMGRNLAIETERSGLVIWLDRNELKNIQDSAEPRPSLVPEKHESHLRLLRTSLQYLCEKGFGSIPLSTDDLLEMLDKVDDLFRS